MSSSSEKPANASFPPRFWRRVLLSELLAYSAIWGWGLLNIYVSHTPFWLDVLFGLLLILGTAWALPDWPAAGWCAMRCCARRWSFGCSRARRTARPPRGA